MSNEIRTRGVILRSSALGENSKAAVCFTENLGKISVAINGAKKIATIFICPAIWKHGYFYTYAKYPTTNLTQVADRQKPEHNGKHFYTYKTEQRDH